MLRNQQRERLAHMAERYAASAHLAHEYLSRRGIDTAVTEKYMLGFVSSGVPDDSEFAGRLSIPYVTPAGVVDIRFRAIQPEQSPKYLGRANSVTRMYNTRALLTDSPVIVVCEGELDTLVMDGIVGQPAVGVPGVSNWKAHFRLLLEDFDTVLVFCDGDQPGRDFGKRVCHELDNARAVHLPDGMDVNEALLVNGVDWLRGKLS